MARAHLAGTITAGSYLLRLDNTVTFFVVDLDLTKRALEEAEGRSSEVTRLRDLVSAEGLRLLRETSDLRLSLLLADSGFKGRHLWGLLEQPLEADLVCRFGRLLRRHLVPQERELSLEFFPKQARTAEQGLGNLVKLPLGMHRRSGRRALFLDAGGSPIRDPWPILRSAPRVGRSQLLETMARLRDGSPAVEDEQPSSKPLEEKRACSADALATDAELLCLQRGCAVLRALVHRATEARRLTNDERIILQHTMGHSERGVDAVNFLFEQCPEVPRRDFLQRPLRGNPISCARIRSRVPGLTATLACNCAFDVSDAEYPNPRLHLRTNAVATLLAQPKPDLREALAAALGQVPGKSISMPGGEWRLGSDGEPAWWPLGAV